MLPVYLPLPPACILNDVGYFPVWQKMNRYVVIIASACLIYGMKITLVYFQGNQTKKNKLKKRNYKLTKQAE
ncbi:hypothetical protein AYY17_13960 [Morganella psychrotolerans]|uniref:Uncharacterized protein n=1 Tax=Morganella psychrotolerans TaxID=368603 RepID=A0A1B8GZ54_9GAMM|nr:hypothetical protein AYY17_13960 [Morganella psychrotolerans]